MVKSRDLADEALLHRADAITPYLPNLLSGSVISAVEANHSQSHCCTVCMHHLTADTGQLIG